MALVLLTLAFFLRLFGASTEAEFTQWVYRSVSRIMEPFRGIFPSEELDGESVLDFSLLFAMIIYSILALALHSLVEWLSNRVRRLGAAAASSAPGPAAMMAPSPGTATSPYPADRAAAIALQHADAAIDASASSGPVTPGSR